MNLISRCYVAAFVMVGVVYFAGGCGPTVPASFTTPYSTTYHVVSPITIATSELKPAIVDSVFISEMARSSIDQFDASGNLKAVVAGTEGSLSSAVITNDFLMFRTHPVELVIVEPKDAVAEEEAQKKGQPRAPRRLAVYPIKEFDALPADRKDDYNDKPLFRGVVPVGSSRVDLQACKLEYSIVSPK